MDQKTLGTSPENVLIVPAAPEVELLKRAVLCIAHAGLDTALETLSCGVPMVAMPVGYDQPGVAARTAYHGIGEVLEVDFLSADRLQHSLVRYSRSLLTSSARYNS